MARSVPEARPERKEKRREEGYLFYLCTDATPHRRGSEVRDVTGSQQQMGFIGVERFGGSVSLQPITELALRQTLLRQPKSLAIVMKGEDRSSAAVAEQEDAAGEWIFQQLLLAEPKQRVNALPPIDPPKATNTRMGALIWIITPLPAKPAAAWSNLAAGWLSIGCASSILSQFPVR